MKGQERKEKKKEGRKTRLRKIIGIVRTGYVNRASTNYGEVRYRNLLDYMEARHRVLNSPRRLY